MDPTGTASRQARLPGGRVGVRARATAAAVAVVALALAGSAFVLVGLVNRTIQETVTTAASTRVQEIAAGLDGRGASDQPVLGSEDGALVQVLRGDRVVAASPDLVGVAPLTAMTPGPGQEQASRVDGSLVGEPGDSYRLVVLGVNPSTGADRVVAVQSLAVAEDTAALVSRLALVGVPVLLAVVAAATWWSVGRALRPVEAIRARTARIGADDLSARVPQPGTRDEIAALASTMNAMLSRLEASAARQRSFVSDAGHELRSPIATIRTETEVAQRVGASDRTHQVVLDEAVRLERLVTDMLTLASTDEGHGRVGHRQDVDLDDLLSAERSRLRARAGLQVSGEVAPARVWGDPGALARVVRNAVDNAVRHSRGRVHLSCGPAARGGADGRDGGAWFAVEDDGPGIPVADRERVFGRFVRLDEARAREDGGSGLGLAIVRDIVTAHGGEVRFTDPQLLPGARLLVELPAQPPPGSSR
ncbi:cell wall metabolism sensor histidine kinase WalK [Klenkia sp. PcliD-1-E]|uniref:sensor histidine kinase n=1 Tax=Klenkia sp. PcliD-1-E TaxID=2954492 RepID=UPI002097B36E|nr:HAMP domain-containing sensor histidine kinase [Klenkia sp. PcliD-1-E]MCO7218385.1 HAMP domain-containing histidine kinase [Klenkia sp. PcliD-1-E]